MPRRFACALFASSLAALFAGLAAPALSAAEPTEVQALILRQTALADRFRRLEELLLRRAEVSAEQEPDQADLLRQAVKKSQQEGVAARFEEVAELLRQDRVQDYRKAEQLQTRLDKDLKDLLELLLSEDRASRLDSERERLKRYLEWINRLLRMQKSIQGQTEISQELERIAQRQEALRKEAERIANQINEAAQKAAEDEASGKPAAGNDSPGSEAEGSNNLETSESSGDGQPEQNDADRQGEIPQNPNKPDQAVPEPPKDSKEGDPSSDSRLEGGENPSSESEGSGQPPMGPSQGRESPEGRSPGGQSESAPPGQESSSDENQDSRTQEQVKRAQEHMKRAKEELEKAQRDGAREEQEKAVRNLEQARAELERILRQLREEEVERLLARLEPRLKQMLEAQRNVYDGTQRLAAVNREELGRDVEVEAGRLGEKEQGIILQADRALMLMREEGSTVALPEALSQARADMVLVRENLGRGDIGDLTITVEEDILAALEEMIAALEQAQRDLEEKRQQPPMPPGDMGEPEEMPLVDQIQELKMIRSLQIRINRRTEYYTKLIQGEQSQDPAILAGLLKLAGTQSRIEGLTRDIVLKKNQ